MIYLLIAVVIMQLAHFAGYSHLSNLLKKKDKSADTAMNNLHQWIVSNGRSTMQSLEKLQELTQSIYVRTRMIDVSLRNKTGDMQSYGQELREMESLITDSTQKEAIEKIRGEDLQYFYSTLIEELRQLNRQISKNGSRAEINPGTGTVSGNKYEQGTPVNGWYNRVDKVL
ncbi:MAG TPA: hypothetical protein VGM41_11380 [Chitinophagaceae bacterium]